jgi:hypothetical protein
MESHSITRTVFDRVIAFLAKIFLPTCEYDPQRARDAALEALAEYDPRTNRELRLAALALAFSLGALDALSRAADDELSVNQVLRLRSSANALHRSASHAEQALAEEREAPEETGQEAVEIPLPDSTEPADMAAFARTTPPLSRQQRRQRERDAEKRRLRQEAQARKAQKDTQRDAHAAMQTGAAPLTTRLPMAPMLPPGPAGAEAHVTSAMA